MRFLDLPKLKHFASVSGMSPALIAAGIVLLGTSMGTGVAGALAQSAVTSPGTATSGVTDPVASGGLARGSGATPAVTGNVTPAFGSTPTPAFSSTPTPALSGSQTSPIGGTVNSTPVDGTSSGGVAGTIPPDGDTSLDASPNRPGNIAASGKVATHGAQASLPNSRSGSAATVNSPADRFGQGNTNPIEVGSAFVSSRSSRPAANDVGPDFVIVTGPAARDSSATARQFIMVCNSSDTQFRCKTPPIFITEKD